VPIVFTGRLLYQTNLPCGFLMRGIVAVGWTVIPSHYAYYSIMLVVDSLTKVAFALAISEATTMPEYKKMDLGLGVLAIVTVS